MFSPKQKVSLAEMIIFHPVKNIIHEKKKKKLQIQKRKITIKKYMWLQNWNNIYIYIIGSSKIDYLKIKISNKIK